MPNINTYFTDKEYTALNVAKAKTNKEWHDFFLSLIGYKIKKVSTR